MMDVGGRGGGAEDNAQVFLTWAVGWVEGHRRDTGGQISGSGDHLTQVLRREPNLNPPFREFPCAYLSD